MIPVERFSEQLIDEACQLYASDIHIIPREKDSLIQYRIDEDMLEKYLIPKWFGDRLISHLKFLASMDIGEKRRPQNGALTIKTDHHFVNLRLSTLPTVYDESLVIRILPQKAFQPLSKLSLFQDSTKKILSFLKHSHGLIIFTGPTVHVI